ncbi:AfsR/SARP family transcriptional regulator [Actinokineospora spheciospongiae]|uniref:AfsR/SARP family transcriptional regulator n=1 Tax=Actinokineospora spheciospongiae TaxID=909613 RepID=UPI000D710B6C|nr:AfsR/SARP family transcriptional regulator [Actinokineospora spheciospongiae]PWW63351.1 DNA-binding SARP family transcriptional activator [Actinokineospora spheciospongiae]
MLRLLGEVAVHAGGHRVDLGPARQRCLLAALALDAGRVVPVDQLVERVWAEDVPRRGRATLHSYLSRLRQALAGVDWLEIARRPGGYALVTTGARAVDVVAFRDLCARARSEPDPAEAARLLTDALDLWRGEALTGLDSAWAAVERAGLDEERIAAQCDLVDARLRTGHGEHLVAELATRVANRPLDERVAGQYMLALHQAGRTADALAHYRRIRDRLVEELGTEPGTRLQQWHGTLLAAGRAPTIPPAALCRQLPRAPRRFVGRHRDLARLDAALAGVDPGAPVVISALTGAGGIGKTWLALHWAHRHADRFPDGQLFVDLRGFSPEGAPLPAAAAVRGFLDAFGVEPARIPVDPHAAATLFRGLVAGKRVLVVLDNAADSAQVAPLLPDSDRCTVLITSRTVLTGLLTRHGAGHLPLDVLSAGEARALLADRIGTDRATAEAEGLDRLVELCGGFPLALSLVAAHALTRPRLTLVGLAAALGDLGLEALADTDPAANLRAVLSLSLTVLTPEQATAYALLGTAPGRDIGLPAAASLLGLPETAAAAVLRALEQASLLTGSDTGRHRMHDLIRLHAGETAQDLPADVVTAALDRLTDFYLHTARNADAVFNPDRPSLDLAPPVAGCAPLTAEDDAAATRWFSAERDNLLATQRAAADRQLHRVTWGLAGALETYLRRRGHLRDRLAVWTAAVDAVAHLSDPTAHVRAHRLLGRAHADLGQHDEAGRCLRAALALAEHHDDDLNQAHTHRTLASAAMSRGDSHQARDHAEHALRICRTLGDPLWEAGALNAVGWYAAISGDLAAGREHCREAYDLFLRHDNTEGQATTLDSLGYIAHHSGRHADSVDHYLTALALLREIGSAAEEADTLDRLGHAHAALGQHDRARAAWQSALGRYEEQGREGNARELRALLHSARVDTPAEGAGG